MKKDIHSYANEFNLFVANRFPDFTNQIIDELLKEGVNVYLFSGIIRDFFLYKDTCTNFSVRDLDIVVSDIDKFKAICRNETRYEVNSFGGLKVFLNDTIIDVWQIDKTWGLTALKDDCLKQKKELVDILPETVFFNSSSILFDFYEKNFIENSLNSFQKFLGNKVLDIILEENPLPELCIINTLHYSINHNLKISKKLSEYIWSHFEDIEKERFDVIQQKHFKKIKYQTDNLKTTIQNLLVSES